MPTSTTNYGLQKPLVNDPTDEDLWGNELNADMDSIDTLLSTAINWTISSKIASFSIAAPTAASTVTGDSKTLFRCNSTSGAIVASLPPAATASGMVVRFIRLNVAGNAITIQANGAEVINGSNTLGLSGQYDTAELICNGTGWNNQTANTSSLAPLASPTFTGVPTAPTAASGTSTTQLATTAFVNPGSSHITSGYEKLASGLIMQWGTANSTVSGATVTFPLAFPTACFNVVATFAAAVADGTNPLVCSTLTTANFNLRSIDAGTVSCFWQAVGN